MSKQILATCVLCSADPPWTWSAINHNVVYSRTCSPQFGGKWWVTLYVDFLGHVESPGGSGPQVLIVPLIH